jgi:hypothetical protein
VVKQQFTGTGRKKQPATKVREGEKKFSFLKIKYGIRSEQTSLSLNKIFCSKRGQFFFSSGKADFCQRWPSDWVLKVSRMCIDVNANSFLL